MARDGMEIRDALRGLKIEIGRTTVATLLAQAGIEPAPERIRKRTWKHFLKSHWDTLYACNFFSVEVLGVFGTVRHMVFFVMEVNSRAVQLAGIQPAPNGDWMKQIARNLLDAVDGFLRDASCLVHDRGSRVHRGVDGDARSPRRQARPDSGAEPEVQPTRGALREDRPDRVPDQFVIFGQRHLRHLLKEFMGHYLTERYHQGIGSQIIQPMRSPSNDNAWLGAIRCRSRLGGALNYYSRTAS